MVMSLMEVIEVVEVMRGVRQRAKALLRWSGGESWSAVHTRGGHSALLKAENSASRSASGRCYILRRRICAAAHG
ncbi:hypothetical protein VDG05_06975 [Xanthomonas campestris pv. raphani]|uniref:hypothetical protein n=1 Tax=Xanthomonas campestris TaxID=339 RepID=UPI002B23BFF5|nr:hypothetical protein [Xanthomonas campestris]MEA9884089.1 hypothetical protein [Xanthomonas campestris pv. raphani]